MTDSRIRTKEAVLDVLTNAAQAGGGEHISIRLVAPLLGAELGTWRVTESDDGTARLEIDDGTAPRGVTSTVNVALTNTRKSSGDEDTGVSVVVENVSRALVRRSESPDWVYLTVEPSNVSDDQPTLTFDDEAGERTEKSVKPKSTNGKDRLKTTISVRKLAASLEADSDYKPQDFIDPSFQSDNLILMKSLSYVRSKLFDLKLGDDDLIFLLSKGLIDRKDARDALKWNAFVRWTTPIIEGDHEIPESVTSVIRKTRFRDNPSSGPCLTRTARSDERIYPKEFGTVVQFSEGIDLNSFLRRVSDQWREGRLTTAQINLLNQLNFMISDRHGEDFGTSHAFDLIEVIDHLSKGGQLSEIESKTQKSLVRTLQGKIGTDEIDDSLLMILAVVGIGPAFERQFRSQKGKSSADESESSSEQPLDAPVSDQNASDGSESVEDATEPQKAVRRPAARKDQQKSVSDHVALAPPVRRSPFGSSLMNDLTPGSSAESVRESRIRRRR